VLSDEVRSATALVFLGPLHQALGREDGRALIERGLERLRAAGDDYGVAIATGNLGDFAFQAGDYAEAALLSGEAAAKAREHGFEVIEAMGTCNQTMALVHESDPSAAETARSALGLCARTGMHLWIGNTLYLLAAAIADAEPRRAAALLGASEAQLQGARMSPAETAVYERAGATARAALGDAVFEEALEEGRLLTRDQAVELGLRPLAAPVDAS
jgi:hypothetical protein